MLGYDVPTLMQFVIAGLAVGCVYSLVALGFTVIFNASGILNFSQGSFVMLGGMLTYVFYEWARWPLALAALAGAVVVAAIGLVAHGLVISPLWRRHSPLYTIIIATFGIHIVLENAALLGIGSIGVGLPAFVAGGPLTVLGVGVNLQMVWIAFVAVAVMVGLNFFFRRTLTGRAMRACAVNAAAASLMGIEVRRMIRLSFVISALLGAVAGILITPAQFTQFNVGHPVRAEGVHRGHDRRLRQHHRRHRRRSGPGAAGVARRRLRLVALQGRDLIRPTHRHSPHPPPGVVRLPRGGG